MDTILLFVKKIQIVIGSILVLLLVNSCENKVDPSLVSNVFNDKTLDLKDSSPKRINFVIDRSASIRGFVKNNNNQFIRTIQDIIQNIPSDIPIYFYELDSDIRIINSHLLGSLNQISKTSFYAGTETNISKILSLPEVKDKNNLTLIFSDWIHSIKDDVIANQMVVFSRELKDFIKNQGLFGIFGKSVPYSGNYFVECKPPATLNFDNPNLKRPFFCIALGNKGHSIFLRRYLEPFYEKEIIIGYENKIKSKFIQSMGFQDYTEPSDTMNTAKIKLTSSDTLFFSIRFNNETLKENELLTNIDAFEVIGDDDSIYSKKTFENIMISLDSIKKYNSESEYFFRMQLNDLGEDVIVAKLAFIQTIPKWITDWSCECDNNIDNAQKVYQLDRWINTYILNDLDVKSKTIFYKYLYIWR